MKIGTIVCIAILIFMAGLTGNKIGFEAAKAKYHGAQQDADNRYGCTVRNQSPNGECQ